MGSINLTNSKGRHGVVGTQRVATEQRLRWVDDKGRQASCVRICRAPLSHDFEALLKSIKTGDALVGLGEALQAGDPEIDLERSGAFLRDTSRVYVDPDQKI